MAGAPPVAPPRASVWEMYRALVGVGLVCGLLIVLAFVGTGPIIAQNRAEALEAAIFRVLPAARASAAFAWRDGGGFVPLDPGERAAERVYAGYGEDGALVGVAIEAAGMGYQDVISLLYGYDPAAQAIVGMVVLESRETPGLGDKIEKDAHYLKNFERLDVSLDAAGQGLAHPVAAVKPGEKTDPWQVDTITGATISSNAVAEILGRSAAAWAPRVRAHLDDLRKAEP